jgi:hypothetical protein
MYLSKAYYVVLYDIGNGPIVSYCYSYKLTRCCAVLVHELLEILCVVYCKAKTQSFFHVQIRGPILSYIRLDNFILFLVL